MDKILENINTASLRFLEPLTLDETYARVVQEALKLVSGDDGFIVRQKDDTFITVYGSSPAAANYKVRQRGNSYKAFTSHKALIMHEEEIQKVDPDSLKKNKIHSVIFIPLSYKGDSEGVLVIRSAREKKFTTSELKILQLFGSFASLAIKKNQLYDQTKQALEVRDHFIALASHELRTPLTSINGYIQMLHEKLGKKNDLPGEWIRELYVESNRLTKLVQELLEINRMKQGQLQFFLEEVHLVKIIEDAIFSCGKHYPKRRISFATTVTVNQDVVIGDYEKLLRVVTALLSNALKFSVDDSSVIVRLTIKKHNLHLQIADSGNGIAQDDIAKVFEGFYKGTASQKAGIGVGLLFAKHILQYHHGSIKMKSELNKGTTVDVTLPQQRI
jgi:signal transduction histidine kinase